MKLPLATFKCAVHFFLLLSSVFAFSGFAMPPKTKKQKLFQWRAEVARCSKTVPPGNSVPSAADLPLVLETSTSGELEIPAETASAEGTDSSDASFDPDQSMSGDTHATLESFVEDWTLSLSREDIVSPLFSYLSI